MYSKLRSTKREQRTAIALPPSIAETYVGLRSYLGEGVYLLENGYLGVTYSVDGIYDEVLTENDLYSEFSPYAKFLGVVSRGLPAHKENSSTIIQIICSQRVTTKPDPLTGTKNGAGAFIAHEMCNLFKGGLIQRRYFLTVRWAPENRNLTFDSARKAVKLALAPRVIRHRSIDRVRSAEGRFRRNLSVHF